MAPIVELQDIEVIRQDRKILDVPYLAIGEGETLAIIGPNGAGKSTLLQVLALLLKPNQGLVHWRGKPVWANGNLLSLRRRMALVLQEPLLRNLSTWENVATGLRFRRLSQSETMARVEEWLSRLGIGHLAKRNARTLSGGEAQRTNLARALVLKPELLLLDEPFASLDAPSRSALMDDLRHILNQVRVSTVFVTHDRTEALVFADQVAVMLDGRIEQLGTPEEVFGAPATEAVARFVEVETVISTTVLHQAGGLAQLQVASQGVEVVSEFPAGTRVFFCIRPEYVTLIPFTGSQTVSSARNRLLGVVKRVDPWGPVVKVLVDCGFSLVSLITHQSAVELEIQPGRQVLASFKASSAHLIQRE